MTLLLTLAGMMVADEIYKILPKPKNEIKLAHIVTAANVEEDASYMIDDKNKLISTGVQVEDVDIAVTTKQPLKIINNDQAVLVDGDIIKVVGKGEEIRL